VIAFARNPRGAGVDEAGERGRQASPEERLKHLEFVQPLVPRMAGYSFLLKGWTVTLSAALFALAAKDANARSRPSHSSRPSRGVQFSTYDWDGDVRRLSREIEVAGQRADALRNPPRRW